MESSLPLSTNVNSTTVANSYSWLNHVDVLILKSFLIVLTVTLNTIVVFVFTCLIRKRTYTNFLFLSISISDLGIGLLAMSSQVISDMDIRWPFGPHLCLLSLFSQLALPDITVQALLFLTIQRFTQLRFPMTTSERFTACNIIKLSLLWSFSIFFWCVYTASLARHGFLDTSERCHLDYPNLAFVLFKVCLFSVAPLILIITLNASSISFLYNKKYRLLNRTRTQRFMSAPTLKISKNGPKSYSGSAGQTNRRMRSKSMMNKNKRRNSKPDDKILQNMRRLNYAKINRNLKALGCLFALSASIAFTQIPFIIFWPISIAHRSNMVITKMHNLSVWISYLTSLINSVLIFVFNETAKREIKRFFRRRYKNTPSTNAMTQKNN